MHDLAPALLVGQPDHVLVVTGQQPFTDVEDLLHAGSRDLPGTVDLLAATRLERGQQ